MIPRVGWAFPLLILPGVAYEVTGAWRVGGWADGPRRLHRHAGPWVLAVSWEVSVLHAASGRREAAVHHGAWTPTSQFCRLVSEGFVKRPSSRRGSALGFRCAQFVCPPPPNRGSITLQSEAGGLRGPKAGEAGDVTQSLRPVMKRQIQGKLLTTLRFIAGGEQNHCVCWILITRDPVSLLGLLQQPRSFRKGPRDRQMDRLGSRGTSRGAETRGKASCRAGEKGQSRP